MTCPRWYSWHLKQGLSPSSLGKRRKETSLCPPCDNHCLLPPAQGSSSLPLPPGPLCRAWKQFMTLSTSEASVAKGQGQDCSPLPAPRTCCQVVDDKGLWFLASPPFLCPHQQSAAAEVTTCPLTDQDRPEPWVTRPSVGGASALCCSQCIHTTQQPFCPEQATMFIIYMYLVFISISGTELLKPSEFLC